MERLFKAEAPAMIKSRKLKLEGESLKIHIGDVKNRIATLECLRVKQDGSKPKKKGKKRRVKRKEKGAAQVASLKIGDLNLGIEASCQEKAAVFKITNKGGTWPRLGVFTFTVPRVKSRSPNAACA